jgi:hypothetical protein
MLITQITLDYLQYSGALFGIIGGVLVSWNTKYSKYGFIFATVASIILAYWCFASSEWGYFTLNVVYLVIDVIGIYRWFFIPLNELLVNNKN